jgi:hypothetical protein
MPRQQFIIFPPPPQVVQRKGPRNIFFGTPHEINHLAGDSLCDEYSATV